MVTRSQRKRVSPERAAAYHTALQEKEKLAALYQELAEEDRTLANAGLEEYASALDSADRER